MPPSNVDVHELQALIASVLPYLAVLPEKISDIQVEVDALRRSFEHCKTKAETRLEFTIEEEERTSRKLGNLSNKVKIFASILASLVAIAGLLGLAGTFSGEPDEQSTDTAPSIELNDPIERLEPLKPPHVAR